MLGEVELSLTLPCPWPTRTISSPECGGEDHTPVSVRLQFLSLCSPRLPLLLKGREHSIDQSCEGGDLTVGRLRSDYYRHFDPGFRCGRERGLEVRIAVHIGANYALCVPHVFFFARVPLGLAFAPPRLPDLCLNKSTRAILTSNLSSSEEVGEARRGEARRRAVREGVLVTCRMKPVSTGSGCMMRGFVAIALACVLYGAMVDGFYLPGSYMHAYQQDEDLMVKVNSLTSIDTELPFGYYTLPFCQPEGGEKHEAENIGELLIGDSIENSPYKFKTNVNESTVVLCVRSALDDNQVKHFQQRIDDFYQINLILDNLPVTRFTKARDSDVVLRWTGFPIGFRSTDDKYHIYNHLKFKVLIHDYEDVGVGKVMGTGDGTDIVSADESGNKKGGYLVVGFEVVYCSVPHDFQNGEDPKPKDNIASLACEEGRYQEITVGKKILYTYDVQFVKSDIRWPSRWDAFLKMEGARVHWFSILNSLMVISFLAGIVFVIFLRTVRRDLTRYEELDKEAQAQMAEELSGWKLVVGDVFRAPNHTALLCIMVGDGVQITGMAVVTILFAAFGFMSPASRGMLLTGMVLLYLFLGIGAGYAASRLWRTLKRDPKGWRGVSWGVACFFPGIAFGILTVLNSLLWAKGSTGAIPVSLFFILLALWFCISVPLTLLGGFLGARAEQISYPVRTNQIPREIPPQKYPSWLLVLGAGTLPFGTLFIELFFIMSSIWMGRVYYVFGFLFVVLVLLVIVCAEVSVVLTYMHLCVEDWAWWWKSFFASGSVAFYVFLYAMNYLIFDLHVKGTVSAVLYVGYSVLMALAIMLATGTIGFLVSFYFVHYLFSSVKLD